MYISNIALSLPNGFHDAILRSIMVDYDQACAIFTLAIWVGTIEEERRRGAVAYRGGLLHLNSLRFFSVDPTVFLSRNTQKKDILLDGGTYDDLPKQQQDLLPVIVQEKSFYWFYITTLNSFIYIDALEAKFTYCLSGNSLYNL